MNSERIQITQPTDWLAAFKRQAKREKLTLSAWIGQQCIKGLSKSEQKKLGKRQTVGRPKQ